MRYVLRVGKRAVTSSGETVALPIEGARALVDGDILRVLLAYTSPTDSERQAVTHGPVELGVFSDGPATVLLLRLGRPDTPAFIETKAPLHLLTGPGSESHPCLSTPTTRHENAAKELASLDPPKPTIPAELVLCDSDTHLVEAVRTLHVPDCFASALREAARRQHIHLECAAITCATLHTLRHSTVADLMARATERCRIEAS